MTISQLKTQSSLKNHFREIIDRIGVCDSIKTKYPKEYIDFCEVFKRHSEYPDKFIGLVDIKIDYNKVFTHELVVYIIKTNGEIDNVSVMKNCITGKPKDNLQPGERSHFRVGATFHPPEVKTLGWTDCGCNAGWKAGIVLDPFAGVCTTAVVAKKLKRNWIMIEINPQYCEIGRRRLNSFPEPLF